MVFVNRKLAYIFKCNPQSNDDIFNVCQEYVFSIVKMLPGPFEQKLLRICSLETTGVQNGILSMLKNTDEMRTNVVFRVSEVIVMNI